MKNLVRKEILNFTPYIPGKPVDEVKREFKIINKIIKLASNENAIGVSKKVISKLSKALGKIFIYPESSCYYLRNKLAKKLKVSPKELICGAGSDEIIEIIAKTFLNPSDNIIVSEHAFIRYKMAGDLMGCKIISVPMKEFTHDLAAMAGRINSNTKAVFVANPNNPTGTYNTVAEVEQFLETCSKMNKDMLVIFDEAYYEYSKILPDYPEMTGYRAQYPNLIILRTFSKIYGLAGLRIGYGIMNKEIIEFLDRIRPPFNVNSIAQAAAILALDDTKHVKDSIRVIEEGKKYLYKELKKLNLEFVPSGTNFILIKVSPLKGKDVFTGLLKKGMIVRAMDEYDYPDYIRVTIGKPGENKKFIKYVRELLTK